MRPYFATQVMWYAKTLRFKALPSGSFHFIVLTGLSLIKELVDIWQGPSPNASAGMLACGVDLLLGGGHCM